MAFKSGIFALIVALTAAGQTLAAPPPRWLTFTARPSPSQIRAAFPPKAYADKVSGDVELTCLALADGQLTRCEVDHESPAERGFGEAALSLAPFHRIRPIDDAGRNLVNQRVQIDLRFLAPGDRDPEWAKTPSNSEMLAALPPLAAEHGVGGEAAIGCHVTPDGVLDACEILRERPLGYDFGAAALLLAPKFRMKPALRAGKSAPGRIILPIIFYSVPGDLMANGLMRDPSWERVPTRAEVVAAFPAGADKVSEGMVMMRCAATADGFLRRCKALTETPAGQGFAAAALTLSERFKIRVSETRKVSLTQYKIDVPVHFSNPAEPDSRSIDRPTWISSVHPDFMAALYPAAALQAGVKAGAAEADCLVDTTGRLNRCAILHENPADLGFGAAALKVSEIMVMNPWTQKGEPVEGLHYVLPVRFLGPGVRPKP